MYTKKVSPILLVSILVLTVTACSSSYHIPVYDNVPQQIKSTDIIVAVNQEKIKVDYEKSKGIGGALTFGLIGALIDSAINSSVDSSRSSEADILGKPFVDATVDVNFSDEFVIVLNKKLQTISWLKANNASVKKLLTKNKITEIVNESSESAVLFVATRYYISPDLNSFNIVAILRLYPKEPGLTNIAETNRPDDEIKMLYRNKIKYTFKLPGNEKDKESATKAWVKSNAKTLKLALRNGMVKIAEMIVFDLSKPVSRDKEPDVNENDEQKEIVVASGKNYKVTRLPDGKLFSTNN